MSDFLTRPSGKKLRRWSLFALSAVFLVVTMYGVFRVQDPEAAALIAGAGAVLGGATMGVANQMESYDSYDERQLLIRYRSGYVAAIAMLYFLLPLAMGSVDNEAGQETVPLGGDQVVQLGFAFLIVVFGAARLYYERKL